MNDATSPSERIIPTDPHQMPETCLERRTPRDDDWEYYKRGPKLLASIGNRHQTLSASQERLTKQRQGLNTTYIHRWRLKTRLSHQTTSVSKDAQALANKWGRPLCRSRDEPHHKPVFLPDAIRFSAVEDGCDDFRFPHDWNEKEPVGYGCCNTEMLPYNQLVAATLLAMKHHLGDHVEIDAAGDYRSSTWGAAMNLYLRTFPDRDVPNLDNWPGAQGHVK